MRNIATPAARPLLHLSLIALCLATVNTQATTVTIDTSTTYQTMRGWGCVNSIPAFLNPDYREEFIYEVVNEFGLSRMRFEIPQGSRADNHRWEWSNDNADPTVTDWSQYNLAGLDENVAEFAGPFAEYVRANGEEVDFYISPSFYDNGSSGEAASWLLDNPGEYTEFAMALLMRLKYVHDLEADYFCILNEANYSNAWNMGIVASKIKMLGPAMQAAGLKTKVEFPESVAVDTAMNYIDQTADDDEMWSWVGVVSYHRYGALTRLGELSDFAIAKGLPTAFTEHSHTNLDRMHEDLTVGNVSYWEVYGLGSEIDLFDTPDAYIQYDRVGWYWRFRQVFYYVRPGAVRVEATSDGAGTLLAWVKDGQTTLNFRNINGTLDIEGLTPGTYGLSYARNSAAYIELGTRTVGVDGKLTLTGMSSGSFYTLYPHPGTNQPPTFTNYTGSTTYLVSPADSFTLNATAQDPELNTISFLWEVADVPAGANVTLATPNAASCSASGLTEPGVYTFTVTASDGTDTNQRNVRCEVFASNPPAIIFDMHNRIPVRVTLPTSNTTLRSSVWNLDNDPFTYQWSVVSQPAGANAQFDTPTTQNTIATNMTVAGDYVFRMTVFDGTSSDTKEHTVTVYPLNSKPNTIANVDFTTITSPTASVQLTSTSTDSNGDMLTHWWRVTNKPDGAHPVFTTPGQADTQVLGMIVPGTYTFEHIVADESTRDTDTVSVTVNAGSSPETLFLVAPNGGETLEPGQAYSIRWASANFAGNVKLEYYNGANWSDIVASTANDGIENWTVPNGDSRKCRIRVSDAADGSPMDESGAYFRILGPRSKFAVIEMQGDFTTGPTVLWNSLPGGYSYQVYYTDTLVPDDWHAIGPAFQAHAGELDLSYQDTSAIGKVRRFYRVEETLLN